MKLERLIEAGLEVPTEQTLENLIYVVGPARGGSSILADALGVHDDIMYNYLDYHFVEQIWPYRHKVHDRLWRILALMPDFCKMSDFESGLSQDQLRSLNAYITETLANKTFKGMFNLYPVLYTIRNSVEGKSKNFQYWCIKENAVRGIERIRTEFPRSKFTFVLRDPRSVALSMARRAKTKTGRNAEPARESADIVRATIYWTMMTKRCLRFAARHPDRTALLRYEDVLENPAAEINRVFESLLGSKLPHDVISARLAALEGTATNEPNQSFVGFDKTPMERWREHLAPADLDLISETAGETARRVGYDLPRPTRKRGILGIATQIPGHRNPVVAATRLAAHGLLGVPLVR